MLARRVAVLPCARKFASPELRVCNVPDVLIMVTVTLGRGVPYVIRYESVASGYAYKLYWVTYFLKQT